MDELKTKNRLDSMLTDIQVSGDTSK